MKVSRAAAKLNQVIHARTLPNWVSAAAIIGAALVYLAMASHVRGAAIPIEQIRSTRDIPTMPASIGAALWEQTRAVLVRWRQRCLAPASGSASSSSRLTPMHLLNDCLPCGVCTRQLG